MKVLITKHRLAINWYMLTLAVLIIGNTLTQIVLMIAYSPLPKYIGGFALSFIGAFLYGFHYWDGKRVLYYRKYQEKVDLGLSVKKPQRPELSRVFVTEDGKLIE